MARWSASLFISGVNDLDRDLETDRDAQEREGDLLKDLDPERDNDLDTDREFERVHDLDRDLEFDLDLLL